MPRLGWSLLLASGAALCQTPPAATAPGAPASPAPVSTVPAPAAPAEKNVSEMVTKESPALFKSRVNLVMVPVVVRDAKGNLVGNLTKESFQLFDKGKPQEITRFTLEKSGAHPPVETTVDRPADAPPATAGEPAAPIDVPERFVAYMFDDLHLLFSDLVRSRDAAIKQLAQVPRNERAAIYTTSGQNQLEFTDDVDKLHATLMSLRSHASSLGTGMGQCPDISYYMADAIINKNDTNALNIATQEALACVGGQLQSVQAAQELARSVAHNQLVEGEQESRAAVIVLKEVVRRMSAMPGQRVVVLISPGFLTTQLTSEKSDIMDRAIRASVRINGLDARGLWTDPSLDASKGGYSTSSFLMARNQFDREAAHAQSDVLVELAMGTGGTSYENNNDLFEGIKRLALAPGVYYVLGFSPQNLKLDGSLHNLKVTVKPLLGMNVQARLGYYAPRKLSSAEETAKQEIEEAVFSRDEMKELAVELRTQYFKSSDKSATLAVLCRVDPRHLAFRKAEGRNVNALTVVSALFDRNGNFVSGQQKVIELKLKDETLARLVTAGALSVKTDFSVAPGIYLVRLVVRDGEGQLMSAVNGAVAIQ